MNAANYRRTIIEAVIAQLLPMTAVRACFEGGSAATGRLDEFSDIDLVVVAPPSFADAAFDAVESALSPHSISHVWRVDPPPFPQTAQRFYFLADAPRFFAVDCVVASEAGVAALLERERHGDPLVYFDRTSTIRARAVDRTALGERRAGRWRQLQGAVPVFAMLVDKELARGRPLEALGCYQGAAARTARSARHRASPGPVRLQLALCRDRVARGRTGPARSLRLHRRRTRAA